MKPRQCCKLSERSVPTKTKRDMSKQIEKWHIQLTVTLSLSTTMTETNRLLRNLQHTIWKLARKAYDLNNRGWNLAELVNAKPGYVRKKILQRIKRVEHTKSVVLHLPSFKPNPSGGISLVKVPTNLQQPSQRRKQHKGTPHHRTSWD
jgi:hypothetical protein